MLRTIASRAINAAGNSTWKWSTSAPVTTPATFHLPPSNPVSSASATRHFATTTNNTNSALTLPHYHTAGINNKSLTNTTVRLPRQTPFSLSSRSLKTRPTPQSIYSKQLSSSVAPSPSTTTPNLLTSFKTLAKLTMSTSTLANASLPQTTIAVWSDIHCPFCWIGKHNFDSALAQLNLTTPEQQHAANVVIEWKSFQLNPNVPFEGYPPGYDYVGELAKQKGWTKEQAIGIFDNVSKQAQQAGCEMHFDKISPVNSFRAHSLAKFLTKKALAAQSADDAVKNHNIAHAIEEDLFVLHFNKTINFNDIPQVVQQLSKYGITEDEVKEAYADKALKAQIETDIADSRKLGINGVPFFLINDKYAVSGAQPPQAFVKVLQQVLKQAQDAAPAKAAAPADQFPVCRPDGTCD